MTQSYRPICLRNGGLLISGLVMISAATAPSALARESDTAHRIAALPDEPRSETELDSSLDPNPAPPPAALDLDLYGSLRMHASATKVDAGFDGSTRKEIGLWDAYSRVGASLSAPLGTMGGNTTLTAAFELNINSAELELGDPSFFDDEDERLYALTASGNWGTLVAGKTWLPYYNHVGVGVDNFSTIYAGYTTYAFFRERQIAYTTPDLIGMGGTLSGTVARIERTGGGASGWHYAGRWSRGNVSVAVGREDMDGREADTQGASISWSPDAPGGAWYLAAKYENSDAFGDIYNGYVGYTTGPWTAKFGLGLGDQFSGDTWHTGVDYRVNDDFKLFAEIYAEDENYAVLRDGAARASDYFGAGGFGARQNGRAFALGFRHDFATD